MSKTEVLHAYRHLYRHGLRAVQFSIPARYTLRDRLRLVFHKGSPAEYDAQKINNTVDFLRHATAENGLEHKIVKNLLFVWWYQDKGGAGKSKNRLSTRDELETSTTAYDTFNHTLRMLNESMDMCLPTLTSRNPF
ncbi:DUF1763-domain-containing protein [Corynespora cassiicola Philippines]|uniref:DUF1763-domain-containing protein n=1 Tax=Corynespora cassiicola Philippines TaxID=1448308 RepID=A0A2T2N9S4_CORCC|nr:DUF1763-domain-containing protein [Corynespora cassiicola Philippines]